MRQTGKRSNQNQYAMFLSMISSLSQHVNTNDQYRFITELQHALERKKNRNDDIPLMSIKEIPQRAHTPAFNGIYLHPQARRLAQRQTSEE